MSARTSYEPRRPGQTHEDFPRHDYTGPTVESDLQGYEEAPPALRALRRQQTAPARHLARVEATLLATLAQVRGWEGKAPTSETESRLEREYQAVLLHLDLHGVGGQGGYEGGSSQRMRWARGLGSGRWQAMDGEAWRAAAQAALEQLRGEVWRVVAPQSLLYVATSVLGPEDREWAVAYALHQLATLVEAWTVTEEAKTEARAWHAVLEGVAVEESEEPHERTRALLERYEVCAHLGTGSES